MCYNCHGNQMDTLRTYNEILQTQKFCFEKWNTTSINHLIISMSNHDGNECKRVAIELYKKFLEWYKINKSDGFFPINGIEKMYSKSVLNNILKISETNNDEIQIMELINNFLEKSL